PTSGYEFAEGVDIEVYLDNDPTNQSFEVWMPIKQ
ncbi:MAG: AraC family transcriptional regulator, partial [Spirochaetia bacterium]|nr:AraC family transcriptional regulator [Spirochaetia bacterium]